MADAPRGRRRRLLSRRELRHRGTRIVRVGSANVLQTNRGQYTFAAQDSARTSQPPSATPDDSGRESIATYSQNDPEAGNAACQRADSVETDGDEAAAAPCTPLSARRRPLHKLTHMSEKAQRLRVSPRKRCSLTSRQVLRPDTVSPPSSPSELPPPLDLDQNILSFTQHDAQLRIRSSTHPTKRLRTQRTSEPHFPPLSPAPHSTARRHLTPLRMVPDRLRPPSLRPPPAFTIYRSSADTPPP